MVHSAPSGQRSVTSRICCLSASSLIFSVRLPLCAAPGVRDYTQFGGQGILVFDIDHNHQFVKRIDSPAGKEEPRNIKGICASATTRRLYETTPTKLYCLDLVTENDHHIDQRIRHLPPPRIGQSGEVILHPSRFYVNNGRIVQRLAVE